MSNLYITADNIGSLSGGGIVTHCESEALCSLGPCKVWGRETMPRPVDAEVEGDPWVWDNKCSRELRLRSTVDPVPQLCHIYAGTFSKTVEELKKRGCRVVYTAAAHNVTVSGREHELLGLKYDYPHLTDPVQWKRYVWGYLAADAMVCPSTHSADVMRGFGYKGRIEVIPHGCTLPVCRDCLGRGALYCSGSPPLSALSRGFDGDCRMCAGSGFAPITPLPDQFRVGYLGAIGPDKGLVYLLRAWAKLNYSDALLVLGGRDSTSPWVHALLQHTGARNVLLTGWLDDVSQFYDQVSLYVQPSVTEGFGIEVLEAMAAGRPVLCSTGAGAYDLVPEQYRFPAGDVDRLAALIDNLRRDGPDRMMAMGRFNREVAKSYTWNKIRARYVRLWQEVLGG